MAFTEIWKAKIPLKIKIFMWLDAQKIILTKENMIAINWNGDPRCFFCGEREYVDHLLFSCPIARVVWGLLAICFAQPSRLSSYEEFWSWIHKALPRGLKYICWGCLCWALWMAQNKTCFEKKHISGPSEIIYVTPQNFKF
jgi:hypothetical protein